MSLAKFLKKEQSIIYPFILSGGSGTRLWPLSRSAYPKQFLPLLGKHSLLQQSCLRLNDPLFASPGILCNQDHRFIVAEQMQELDVVSSQIVLEPVSRNTAPAALIAALLGQQQEENAIVLLMPCDHAIKDNPAFHKSIQLGLQEVLNNHIVVFGINPDGPETGYGYIETIAGGDDIRDVVQFNEKPSKEKAQHFLAAGNHMWNAGIFLYSAKTMIQAFERHAPMILENCKTALKSAVVDLDFLRLEKASYERCENISLDYAIMEKVKNIKCVRLASDWADLGSWSALWEIDDKDQNGNSIQGDTALIDTSNSYIYSTDGACLSVIGMQDIVAVATRDAILITPKNRAQDVKEIVAQLKMSERIEVDHHARIYRPWGWYEQLSHGERFQVKCLMIKPGTRLSLQSHNHRAEHWVVVKESVEVTVGEKTFMMDENQSTFIPIGTLHRLGNPGKHPALLIEVQSGSYLGEDDIVRYEDDFNQITPPARSST